MMELLIQALEGIGVGAAAILAIIGWFVYQYWKHKHLMQVAEHEMAQERVSFHREKRKVLTRYAQQGVNLEVSGEDFKAIVYFPQTRQAKTTVAMEPIEEQKQLPPPRSIPTYVQYEAIERDIPQGHTLLGVGTEGIESRDFSVLDTCWICGGSKTGKTNTVSLKVEEAYSLGTRFVVIDPHKFKPDSLYNAIQGYSDAFLLSVAQSHDEIVKALSAFLHEAKRRRDGGAYTYDITLIVDEIGSLVGDKGKTPEQVQLYQLLYNIARMCGQELRGFGMRGMFISQNAIGLAWLRGFAMTIIVHKLLMENERKVATNNNMAVVRAMDTWPRGRVLVYGLDIEEGQLQLQMPVFRARTVESSARRVATPVMERYDDRFDGRPDAVIVEEDTLDEQVQPQNVQTFRRKSVNAPVAPTHTTSGERLKYQLTDEEITGFLAAYRATRNKDKALSAIGKGSNYRECASRIVTAYFGEGA